MRKVKALVATMISVSLFTQNVYAGIGLPDFGELASEAAEAVSGAVDKAGDVVSDTGKTIGETVSGVMEQAGNLTSGFRTQAGELISDWGKKAGETADSVKESLSEAGIKMQDTASELGSATADKAAELTDKAGDVANNAIDAVKGAGDLVVDQAGHVVDLAAAGAGYVTETAGKAMKVLKDQGAALMQIAQDAVADMDLSNEQNWDVAKTKVEEAIETAYRTGVLDKAIDEDTVQLVTRIIFGSMMYTYQYNNGIITLGEYASSMSEMIMKEGLPTGVGFIINMVIGNKIPHSADIAKEVTYFLVSKAFGDKSGEEIESEEEALMATEPEARE